MGTNELKLRFCHMLTAATLLRLSSLSPIVGCCGSKWEDPWRALCISSCLHCIQMQLSSNPTDTQIICCCLSQTGSQRYWCGTGRLCQDRFSPKSQKKWTARWRLLTSSHPKSGQFFLCHLAFFGDLFYEKRNQHVYPDLRYFLPFYLLLRIILEKDSYNSIETCILSRVKQITSPGGMHETSAWTWCTGKTQRDQVEREMGEGIGMGNTCKSMADSCQCMTNHYNIVK